jgi:two-component system, OmpR family, sensor histidine kinase KdpD
MFTGLRANLRGLLDRKTLALPSFLQPVVMTLAAVLATTVLLLAADAQLAAEHLVLGYLLPTIVIAVYYGSTFAVLTSFVSGLTAAYFLFPPKLSFYISDTTHIAELGFFLLLAIVASKAVAVLMDQPRRRGR